HPGVAPGAGAGGPFPTVHAPGAVDAGSAVELRRHGGPARRAEVRVVPVDRRVGRARPVEADHLDATGATLDVVLVHMDLADPVELHAGVERSALGERGARAVEAVEVDGDSRACRATDGKPAVDR